MYVQIYEIVGLIAITHTVRITYVSIQSEMDRIRVQITVKKNVLKRIPRPNCFPGIR